MSTSVRGWYGLERGITYLQICGSSHIFNKISSNPPFVAVGLVVEVDNVRLGVLVGFVFDERLNGLDVRESFHSKFTVKSASKGLIDLVFLLCSMPHYTLSQLSPLLSTSADLPFH